MILNSTVQCFVITSKTLNDCSLYSTDFWLSLQGNDFLLEIVLNKTKVNLFVTVEQVTM